MQIEKSTALIGIATLAAAVLAGCSMSRPPETIKTEVPAQYREALPGVEAHGNSRGRRMRPTAARGGRCLTTAI